MRQERTKQKQKAREQASQEQTEEQKPAPASPGSAFTNRKNKLWVILSAGMAITILAAQLLEGSAALSSMASIYSAMLWTGIFGAALARYMLKNGWIGFAIGSASGVLLTILIGVIAG